MAISGVRNDEPVSTSHKSRDDLNVKGRNQILDRRCLAMKVEF
jgi:hypothetical protein